VIQRDFQRREEQFLRPYSKSKLKLESNFSENFPVNCKFIRGSKPNLSAKTRTGVHEVWL